MTEQDIANLIRQLDLEEVAREREREWGNGQPEDAIHGGETEAADGWIQVRNHAVLIQDPTGNGRKPVLRCAPPVRLYVNDVPVLSECAVTSEDRIRWEVEEPPLFTITVSEDRMSACFQLRARERHAWRLADADPAGELTLSVEPNEDYVLETVQLSDVLEKVEQMSIVSNLDIDAVQRELEHPTGRPVLFARGKEPVPGKDAELFLYFSDQVESRFFEVSGRVDFRSHLHIPSVHAGELIARKTPFREGIPGYDVFGNCLNPDPPKDIIVVAKPGVELTADGEIRAVKSGRPRVTGHKVKTFDIAPSYVVPGDVDMNTGNIVFAGDVIVCGSVMDHLIIEALGNVYVYGGVFNATITATGSIYVRGNVLGSELNSGYFGVIFNRLYRTSKTLGERIGSLLTAAVLLENALASRGQKARYGQLILLLLENKFQDLVLLVKDLHAILATIRRIRKEGYRKLAEMSGVLLKPSSVAEAVSGDFLQSLLAMLQETHEEVARMQEDDSEVMLNHCHHCKIMSNGDIIVKRNGVILSELYAARHICFLRKYAVCRGSKLEAGGSIAARIVGGQTGVHTMLKAHRQVSVEKMFAGRVCIGNLCVDIDQVVENKTFTIRNLNSAPRVREHENEVDHAVENED